MKTVGNILLAIGVLWALYGAFVTPMMYDLDTASAPQMAQVNSEAARVGVTGLTLAVTGLGMLIRAKPQRTPADEPESVSAA